METSVKERLTFFLKENKISFSEFGREIGVSSAFVSSIRKSIQPDKVDVISSKYPELNIEWLLTGKGEMFQNQDDSISLSSDEILKGKDEHIQTFEALTESKDETIEAKESEIQRLQKTIDKYILKVIFSPSKDKLDWIYPYYKFYTAPNWDMDNVTRNPLFVVPFYDVAIELTLNFDFTDDQFKYYKSNFSGSEDTANKTELIHFLEEQRQRFIYTQNNLVGAQLFNKNDSLFLLGFRSIHYILKQHLAKIEHDYIQELNQTLMPFFTYYSDKEGLMRDL